MLKNENKCNWLLFYSTVIDFVLIFLVWFIHGMYIWKSVKDVKAKPWNTRAGAALGQNKYFILKFQLDIECY